MPTTDCEAGGGTVCRSVKRAEAMLSSRSTAKINSAETLERRLLAPVLSVRHERLCCGLANLQKQVNEAVSWC